MSQTVDQLRKKLSEIGQEQVLRFYDSLDAAGQKKLVGQIESLDLRAIAELAESHVRNKPVVKVPKDIQPVKAWPYLPDAARAELYRKSEERGRQMLGDGKIAAFVVAGGQGTRLGYDGPKGEFKVTPVKHKSLFQVFSEQLGAHGRDAGRPVPWYIMTSDLNDAATRAFFKTHNYFGLHPANVFFFKQGMMPALDMSGKLLLAAKDSLALSPDGHGGSLRALEQSGALADMRKRGVEHLSYFQVDNPMIRVVDPLFMGLHDQTHSDMSSKILPKTHAMEKLGNFVIADGVMQVIEYSDMPEALAHEKDADGTLRYNCGSIAIHALRVDFIERLNAGGRLKLPWHRAEKKVGFVDEAGKTVKPDKVNAVKLEQFVFDAIPLAKNSLVYTTDRADEFSAVKSAEGEDSPATCRRDQLRRAAKWLSDAGVQVPMKDGEPDAILEISPLYALRADGVRQRVDANMRISAGQTVYLE
jgi:UDP-N-acetylglucosamine/UDP-N-acetylgalactosamine diphosphorylase